VIMPASTAMAPFGMMPVSVIIRAPVRITVNAPGDVIRRCELGRLP
jgi:hypothetical protein